MLRKNVFFYGKFNKKRTMSSIKKNMKERQKMSKKHYNEKTFEITKELKVKCWTENTSYGFRHLAELERDYYTVDKAKSCYYNRTWESYDYESVLKKLKENTTELNQEELKEFEAMIKDPERKEEALAPLKSIAGIMSLGNILGQNQKEKNDWKTRMLKAGLENKGLIMPEDWETLSESDKEQRLNGAIEALS